MRNNYREGTVDLVPWRVDGNSEIQPGDMMYDASGIAKPAWEFTWTTDLATTRAAFAAAFIGIAHAAKADDGVEGTVLIDQSPLSVYYCQHASTTVDAGDHFAPAETVSALSATQLESVGNAAHAVARARGSHGGNARTASYLQFGSAKSPLNVNANIG